MQLHLVPPFPSTRGHTATGKFLELCSSCFSATTAFDPAIGAAGGATARGVAQTLRKEHNWHPSNLQDALCLKAITFHEARHSALGAANSDSRECPRWPLLASLQSLYPNPGSAKYPFFQNPHFLLYSGPGRYLRKSDAVRVPPESRFREGSIALARPSSH